MYAVKLLPTCASLLACASALPQSMPQVPSSYAPANGTNGTQYEVTEVGARNTEDWRMWLKKDGQPASFWHDIPTYPDSSNASIVNFVVEIPRWTNGKIEINREEPLNPIFHDTNSDGVRFVESIWPLKSYPFLYGSIPRTWESPNFNHSFTGEPGDNDPMDAFDIGQDPGHVGQNKQVKVLGGLALNDGGETDWKMLVIDVEDPLAAFVESYEDVEMYRPGIVEEYRRWFHTYKIPRGDGYLPIVGDLYRNASFAVDTIAESHDYWRTLFEDDVDTNEINYNQTSTPRYEESYVKPADAFERFDVPRESIVEEANEVPEEYREWYYLDANHMLVEVPGQ